VAAARIRGDEELASGICMVAAAASVHDTRQSVMESTPSGQQGQSSQGIEAMELAPAVGAVMLATVNAWAGTASRSCAMTTRKTSGLVKRCTAATIGCQPSDFQYGVKVPLARLAPARAERGNSPTVT
jgi:hypothetical protein